MIKEVLVLALLSCLMSFTRSQVQTNLCSIHCNIGNVLGQPLVSGQIVKGRPGKRGPTGDVGPKGDKGEPAEQCECNELAGVLQQLQDLQRELKRTNQNFDLIRQVQQALDRRVEKLSNEIGRSQKFTVQIMSALHPIHSEDGHIYIMTQAKQTWYTSRRICQSFGGDLAVDALKQSNKRQKLGRKFTIQADEDGVWVGLTDSSKEGIWKWLDGSTATSTEIRWDSGQPDNARGSQDCGKMWGSRRGYRMDDDTCGRYRYALCEITPLEYQATVY